VTWLSWVGMASDQGDGEEVTDAQMDFLNPTPSQGAVTAASDRDYAAGNR
jgi:hypothetical protein